MDAPENTDCLLNTLNNANGLNIKNAQYYSPILDIIKKVQNEHKPLTIFNINTVKLHGKRSLQEITDKISYNTVNAIVSDSQDNKNSIKTSVFLKFCPIIDTISYLSGKYDLSNDCLMKIPHLPADNSTSVNDTRDRLSKTLQCNNSAYVDCFFTYLNGILRDHYGFVHGIEFYNSFLAHKENFVNVITDDIEYLNTFDFFKNNADVLYTLNYNSDINSDTHDSRGIKPKILIKECNTECNTELLYEDLLCKDSVRDVIGYGNTQNELIEITDLNVNAYSEKSGDNYIKIVKSSNSSKSSNCSSRTSFTTDSSSSECVDRENDDAADNYNGDDGDDDDDDCESDSSEDDLPDIIANIKNIPVQVIAMERCENTLDSLIEDGTINVQKEISAIVCQILFNLITLQKAFEFTHNDLHGDNIMYVKTSDKFLFYTLNDINYKIPTFGKIFKIIDYGRSIYKLKGNLLCSDCFEKNGDANTQYNFPPFVNEEKPIITPNFSFDLCRLGCSLYDYFLRESESEIKNIILDWVNDDDGHNVLYKSNGEERYPEFKLYKMITRKVHKHIPSNVLKNKHFNQYIVSKKTVSKCKNIIMINIDAIPCFS